MMRPFSFARLNAAGLAAVLCFLSAVPAQAAPCELTVSAAASLTAAFKQIAARFESSQACRVRLNFGASGVLVQQMRHGAPVDVLATADQQSMDLAVQHGLINPKSRQDFIANTLVLIAPVGSAILSGIAPGGSERSVSLLSAPGLGGMPASSKSQAVLLQQLSKPQVERIAIGNPASVPAGRYAKEALQHAGLAKALEAKLVSGTHVRQVLDYVVRNEVEAGFVYASDAKGQQVLQLGAVATRTAIRYPLAISTAPVNPAAALAFSHFVRSEAAQQILLQHGFSAKGE